MTATPIRRQYPRDGAISPLAWLALLSCAIVAMLACLALWQRPDARRPETESRELRVYCAAGVGQPISRALHDYRRRYGERAAVAREDGSGRLFGQICAEARMGANRGADLFVSADASLLQAGYEQQIIGQWFSLAIERPVIAALADSDVAPQDLRQLVAAEGRLRFGIASENAAIGKITRQIAQRQGVLPELLSRRKVETENVMQLAQALVTRSLDAAVLWDTTLKQVNQQQGSPVLRIVAPADDSALDPLLGRVAVGVVRTTSHPDAALRLATFLSHPDGGLKRLAEAGFEIVEQVPPESISDP